VSVPVLCKVIWLYLAGLVVLYYKYVFITGCDLGFGKLLARQLDMRDLRVLGCVFDGQGG
jgi:cytochrome bd-type quinol oxidase subunit 2